MEQLWIRALTLTPSFSVRQAFPSLSAWILGTRSFPLCVRGASLRVYVEGGAGPLRVSAWIEGRAEHPSVCD